MEQRLEEFDVHAMRGEGAESDIELLIEMRRQLGKLRRALAAHRSALVALTHPELALANDVSGEGFQSPFTRYEATLQEARDVREAIFGSFDVLTLASVIFLPGALLAGVMGMNFKVGLFQITWVFWAVVAAVAAIAPITVGAAKRARWI